jgi:hypothetical protein
MNGYLRQSTASQSRAIGPFISDSDFKTEQTGLTIANTDVKLRANGTTLANKNSGGGTHQVNGVYSLTFDATDTANVGELFFSVKVAGALAVFGTYVVVEEAVYDALYAASAAGFGTAQTGDAFARLGAPAGASVSADIAAVKVDTAAVKVKTDFLPSATAGAAGGVFIAGTNAATTITTGLTTTFTGNLTGSVGSVTGAVGSVTGAVGSVTGNVGGNVTGSVGSVVGAVGSVTVVNDKTGYRLSATGVDDIHDEAVDGATTFRESTRLANSANGAKLSGAATTTVTVRDLADSKARITATVDSDGNRTAVTRDLT